MSPTLLLNLALAAPFLLAFIGVPLWLTLKHGDAAPDHAEARSYLEAKRLRMGGAPRPATAARRAA